MTTHEIVSLRCPSCSDAITQTSREMPFGAEFGCDNCSITSVLIIDLALVPLSTLQKQGEKVCINCGRIALREARFCQEGHTLIRKCVKCGKEFAVEHHLCDYCGWLQNVTPGTNEGDALDFDRAVREINDLARSERLWGEIKYPLEVIQNKYQKVSQFALKAAATTILNTIHSIKMVEEIGRYASLYLYVLPTLLALGPSALGTTVCKTAVSALRNGEKTLFLCR